MSEQHHIEDKARWLWDVYFKKKTHQRCIYYRWFVMWELISQSNITLKTKLDEMRREIHFKQNISMIVCLSRIWWYDVSDAIISSYQKQWYYLDSCLIIDIIASPLYHHIKNSDTFLIVAWLQCLKWGPALAGPKKIFGASKKLVTGPNGIMVVQTFCDIFFYEKKTSDTCINIHV